MGVALMDNETRVEQARAALVELEERLTAGEPIGRNERRAVNDEYQAAEAALAAANAAEPTGPPQTIGG